MVGAEQQQAGVEMTLLPGVVLCFTETITLAWRGVSVLFRPTAGLQPGGSHGLFSM